MSTIETILERDGYLDRGPLALLASYYPSERVIIAWQDGSCSELTPGKALEEISYRALTGQHPDSVRLTASSSLKLRLAQSPAPSLP